MSLLNTINEEYSDDAKAYRFFSAVYNEILKESEKNGIENRPKKSRNERMSKKLESFFDIRKSKNIKIVTFCRGKLFCPM